MCHLLERLEDADLAVRLEALPEIEAADDERIVAALIRLANDSEVGGRDREAVADAVGRTGHPLAESFLEERSSSDDVQDREFAAIGWGGLANESAVLRLIQMLQDPVNTVRNLAERSLMRTPEAVGRHGVERLLELLNHPQPLMRSPAARLLGLVRDPRAFEPLLGMLTQDRQWLARMWAAKGLGDLGDPRAAEPLSQTMRADEKNRVRAAAVEALGKLRPPGLRELLNEAMKDEDGGVRRLAEECLVAVRDDQR